MLLSEFFTVALIPALINNTSAENADNINEPLRSRSLTNSRFLPLPTSVEESLFQDDFFSGKTRNPDESEPIPSAIRQRMTSDPVLREIYEEEKRLDLMGSGEDFDMRSEEARELIDSQRRKIQRGKDELARRMANVPETLPVPMGRSLPFPGFGMVPVVPFSPVQFSPNNKNEQLSRFTAETSTQYPILIPRNPEMNEEITTTPATFSTTSARTSGIGGVFGKVKNRVDNTFGSIKKIFTGSSGTDTTTTSTTTAPPPPTPQYPPSSSANMVFPDDDGEEENTYQRFPTPTPTSFYPGSNSVVFEGDPPTTTRMPTAAELNCTEQQTVWEGQCHNVLQQLPCAPDQWLIENEETGRGECVENKCAHTRNTAFFGGKCVVPRSNQGDHCHKGMVPYVFKNGDVECDCDSLHLYNVKDGNCYPVYQRGPCDAGEIFMIRITKQGTLPASCVKNKCSKEGYFCNAPTCPRDRNCIALNSKCNNGKGQWEIHSEKLTPTCVSYDEYATKLQKIIGNVPTLACAPGSRRDILGTCRKPSKISFS